jgi:hypothetical protein
LGKLIDLTGRQFNRLKVIKRVENKGKNVMWRCQCDCTNFVNVSSDSLLTGNTSSCGCLKIDTQTKHGLCNDRIYIIWKGIKRRCSNPNYDRFDDYGQRGVEICNEWLNENGFMNFYNWAMQNGYSDNLTIDRKNVNGNYEPDNCRWANTTVQGINKRKRKDNTSNATGVSYSSEKGKWRAYISIYNKRHSLGYFTNKQDAIAVRKKAEEKYHRPLLESC